MNDIHIKARQVCSECGRRLLTIINGMCFKCTAEALARLRESSRRLAEQYQIIIMEQHTTEVACDRLRSELTRIARGIWTAPNSVDTIVWMAKQALLDKAS